MHQETKKLGEMLVDAGLLKPSQLQEALRHQRFVGGRMGGNLVSLGFISEDVLMDFLAQKTGFPRVELRAMDVPVAVLERIPHRLAEQMVILPISFKEPKSLVLAMADPSDLNAIDSARFASGLNIEPMVASHSTLKLAIPEQYRKLDVLTNQPHEISATAHDEGLPVPLDFSPKPMDIKLSAPPIAFAPPKVKDYPADPFFSEGKTTPTPPPFALFEDEPITDGLIPLTDTEPALLIPARETAQRASKPLSSYQTRTLVLGLIQLFQRRGIIGEDELERFIARQIENKSLKDDDRIR
ncbi:General secretory system II protein E domain protein [Holophaga foetida]|uniref:GspE/PulE/PilB domain-containing protein n=1 Tax=Holophaga foetida TaxID=35839 RepID=UPI0002473B24|nr:General secretory system II protein E domain protein [Holophaga foetida]